MEEIARDVAVVSMALVNAYLIGTTESWVLVDSGTPGSGKTIAEAAEARFGVNARPKAILLTHGHFDHAGSADDLSERWDVSVYAARMEWPYLTGRSAYPPMDPTAPGFFSGLSRFFPSKTINVAGRIADLQGCLPRLGFADWEALDTPGHTPGHISFFRSSDKTLLAGDAFTTVNQDNLLDLVTKKPQMHRPPVPATTDWQQARNSVQLLAKLKPNLIGAGHGTPMKGAASELEKLAKDFPIPEHGRYVKTPARFDEDGIVSLPPAPVDRVPKIAAGVAIGALLAGVGAASIRSKSKS